ncbi:FIVAR domain-containing protein, partial [Ligilactobacillus salivarius]
DEIEKGVNFTNADKDLQDKFKQAVQDAKDLLDKAKGTAKNAKEVKAVQDAIKDALDKLNGNQKLADAKDKAKQTVDNLPN